MIIPDKPLLNDQTKSTIIGPDGSVANAPTLILSYEEVSLLRQYKKWLTARGYKEALYCSRCWESNLSHGCEAYVTDQEVFIRCRCRLSYYKGQTLA